VTRSLHIPRHLSEGARVPHHRELRDWVATLPEVVAGLAERWNLQIGEPYEPGGQCSWVAPVRNANGAALVLKVEWRHTEAAHEADALRLWAGDGAVLLHDAVGFNQTSALLLEQCVPGTQLGQSIPEPEQDVVVAGLLKRLWRLPPPGNCFRPLSQMCDEWADEFEARLAASPAAIDAGLACDGIALFRELPRSAATSVVLCTDLHAENILAAAREPWLVIDPKPYVGDPTYDALQHMLNCGDRLRVDPSAFVLRMAELLELDAGRLRRWLFARCVQQSMSTPWLVEVAKQIAP
jgi:streptomycin 6-kinase